MRDQRQRVDRPEQVPGRERERVVVVGRRPRRQRHELAALPRDETGDRRRVGFPLESVGQLAREMLALADACVVEPVAFLERLAADGVDVCATDDDRDVGAILLDPPRDLDGARVLDRHARDPDEIRPILAHPRDDVVDRQVVELPVEQLDLVAGGSQRAGDVRDPERREARPVLVELTARRRLYERDSHRVLPLRLGSRRSYCGPTRLQLSPRQENHGARERRTRRFGEAASVSSASASASV